MKKQPWERTPVRTGDKLPYHSYYSEDLAVLQREWQSTAHIKTVAYMLAYAREQLQLENWSPVMVRLLEDVRDDYNRPRKREVRMHEWYRGFLPEKRRLNQRIIRALEHGLQTFRDTHREPSAAELRDSVRYGIPDPLERVLDFLKLVGFHLPDD